MPTSKSRNSAPDRRGLKVAVVGAGPAGLYSAMRLLEERGIDASIDLFERLPTPWGLVRGAVAPDHPEKKLIVERYFDFCLKSPHVRFLGGVDIGQHISHAELKRAYHAVVYAVGADGDVRMNIPGEELPGSWSAREFVGFYSGHPDYADLDFDLTGQRAIIVGNGNVALDVARVLMTDVRRLERTDISDRALAILRQSRIREVVIAGRRGPLEAAYNNPELEELGELTGIDIGVEGVDLSTLHPENCKDQTFDVRRKAATLLTFASRPPQNGKRITFHFFVLPVEVNGSGKVETVMFKRNVVAGAQYQKIDAGLLFRAIGYRGCAVAGLPFDKVRNVIRNIEGRVSGDDGPLPGVYTSGWIKRGCSGLIGSNKKCAHETIEHLLQDWRSGALSSNSLVVEDIDHLIAERQLKPISLAEWRKIDVTERSAGRCAQRPRVKFADHSALLLAAGRPEAALSRTGAES